MLCLNLLAVIFLSVIFHGIIALCTAPTLPSNSYTLTTTKTSYSSGETYDILCKPGYTLSGSTNLTCTSTVWTPGLPSCSASAILPWWVFLAIVVAAIILIPCILPRIWACICNRKKTEDDKPLTNDKSSYHGRDKGDGSPGIWRKNKPITPITDNGKHKLTQMDAFRKNFPESVYPQSKNAYF